MTKQANIPAPITVEAELIVSHAPHAVMGATFRLIATNQATAEQFVIDLLQAACGNGCDLADFEIISSTRHTA